MNFYKSNREVIDFLDKCGHPYSFEQGSNHVKIKVAGRMIGVLNHSGKVETRTTKNTISDIRKALARL